MKKIFVPHPLSMCNLHGNLSYDYTKDLESQMIQDGNGIFLSNGQQILLNFTKIKDTNLIQGWDLGNGNILSFPQKIVECVEFKNELFIYVAFTKVESTKDNIRSCNVYLYAIPKTEKSRLMLSDSEYNIFDYYFPCKIYESGMNGHLCFNKSKLTWMSKEKDKYYTLCYNLYSSLIERLPKIQCQSTCLIDDLLKTQSDKNSPKVQYLKVNNTSMLYVAIISPKLLLNNHLKAVVICLGGPHIPIPNFSENGTLIDYLSENGYYVIVPLRRGIIGISDTWEHELIGNYGHLDILDIIEASNFASQLLKISISQISLYGGSYGGYCASLIATKYSDKLKFKSVIIHCGITNLISYPNECQGNPDDIMYEYTKTCKRWEYNQRATQISPINFIERISYPVFLIHSIDDCSVWMGQSIRFYNKALKHNKRIDLLLIPGPHSYNTKYKEYLFKYILCYLDKNKVI